MRGLCSPPEFDHLSLIVLFLRIIWHPAAYPPPAVSPLMPCFLYQTIASSPFSSKICIVGAGSRLMKRMQIT
jgi:hypothetical protein